MPSENPIYIRPIRESDLPDVISLSETLRLSPWSIEDYRAEIERADSHLVAAVNEDELVGFIVGRQVPGSDEGKFEAEVYNIGVRPERQMSGIGKLLMSDFLDKCRSRNVSVVWLEARTSNAAAIRFYEKLGFRHYWVRPGFYRDPVEDALVMGSELNRPVR